MAWKPGWSASSWLATCTKTRKRKDEARLRLNSTMPPVIMWWSESAWVGDAGGEYAGLDETLLAEMLKGGNSIG